MPALGFDLYSAIGYWLVRWMQNMQSREVEFSEKLDNILAVERNMHSRELNNGVHKVLKRQRDGS